MPKIPTPPPVTTTSPQSPGPAPTTIPGKTAAAQIAAAGTGFSPEMKKALGQS